MCNIQRPRPNHWQSIAHRPHLSSLLAKASIELFDSTVASRKILDSNLGSEDGGNSQRHREVHLWLTSTFPIHLNSREPFTCHETRPWGLVGKTIGRTTIFAEDECFLFFFLKREEPQLASTRLCVWDNNTMECMHRTKQAGFT